MNRTGKNIQGKRCTRAGSMKRYRVNAWFIALTIATILTIASFTACGDRGGLAGESVTTDVSGQAGNLGANASSQGGMSASEGSSGTLSSSLDVAEIVSSNAAINEEVDKYHSNDATWSNVQVYNGEIVHIWRDAVGKKNNATAQNIYMQDSKQMLYLVPEDDWFWKETATPRNEFMESVQELNGMVGLENLKQNMITLFNRSRFEQARRKMGLPVLEKGGFHMIFTGNPGTGKTTVAKLVGKIFHSLGLLSKGGVVVTERTKLVGRYLGETEKNMVAVLEQAKGNVLFIDEAYSLCDNTTGDRKDFGCRVLESLLTVLAQKNPDMIVILAGYEKEMEQMLEMNPGMKGRFPYKFNFEDYNAEELYQIAYNLLNRADYILTPAADERLKEVIRDAVQHKDAFFHNARWVEQLVWDGVVSALSNRLMETPLELEKREVLQRIEVQDIEMGYRKMKPKTAVEGISRRRIGFVA